MSTVADLNVPIDKTVNGWLGVDLAGQKFGKLTVIKEVESKVVPSGNKYRQWLCKCECGNEIVMKQWSLTRDHVGSCGCDAEEVHKQRIAKMHAKKPPVWKERLYRVWMGMKSRCHNPKAPSYGSYGAKGITVCDEWLHNYRAFRAWAYANGYRDDLPKGGCTIDRIDAKKGYSPDNCQWLSLEENNKRRDMRHVTYNGKEYTTTEFAELIGKPRPVVDGRLKENWTLEGIIEISVGVWRSVYYKQKA